MMSKEAMLSAHHSGTRIGAVDAYVRINMEIYYIWATVKAKICGSTKKANNVENKEKSEWKKFKMDDGILQTNS